MISRIVSSSIQRPSGVINSGMVALTDQTVTPSTVIERVMFFCFLSESQTEEKRKEIRRDQKRKEKTHIKEVCPCCVVDLETDLVEEDFDAEFEGIISGDLLNLFFFSASRSDVCPLSSSHRIAPSTCAFFALLRPRIREGKKKKEGKK